MEPPSNIVVLSAAPLLSDHSRLPAPIMDAIVQYLNPSELARMAQVSKGWQKIVYRPSLWRRNMWRPALRAPSGIFLKSVPADARHLGRPGPACFYMWLSSDAATECLPRSVREISDVRAYTRAAADWWNANKRPCCVIHHHHLSDVLASPFPASASREDIKRLILRIAQLSGVGRENNTYAQWLGSLHADVEQTQIDYAMTLRGPPDSAPTTDPVELWLRASTATAKNKKLHAMKYISNTVEKLKNAVTALRGWSPTMFEANEKWYKDNFDALWGVCAFGLGAD